jgi:anti-sigma regulatory factor (Ser/Thr protein kinase)
MMTPCTKALAGPAQGSAWQWPRPGQPQPQNAGTVGLVAMQSAPFWARRYTRWFLSSCQGVSTLTAETAELLVSELVTNSVRFSGDSAPKLGPSGRVNAPLITLSLRHFSESLLIEVFDIDTNPPVLADAYGDDAESGGRGLMLVDALSKEWSYFLSMGGGKVVYCVIEIAHSPAMTSKPPARAGLDTARAGP